MHAATAITGTRLQLGGIEKSNVASGATGNSDSANAVHFTHEPLVSVVLLAYNQEKYIKEAVQSVLSQTFAPLEIILSDDCSKDNTFNMMESEASHYNGPNTIRLNRNPRNMGLAEHMNRALAMSRGEFIVMHAGDDISIPTRVEKLVARWRDQSPAVDLVCSYFEEIDVDGRSTGHIEKDVVFVPNQSLHPLKWACGATGACASYSRPLFTKYGPLDSRVLSEDWVYPFRACLESGIAVIEEPLVKHRTHDASISVIGRTVNRNRTRAARRTIRRRAAESQLGIAH